ncbi:hypothetical protein PQX77_019646 [Marasmius sp. AFHP31]|nr:hypothetical protein PQX77_019646 [Marasmius sp. AFHP31]
MDAFMINGWSNPDQTVPDSEIMPAAEPIFNQLHENLLKILRNRRLNTLTLKTTFLTDDNNKPRFPCVTEELSPATAHEVLSDWYQTHWTRSGRIGQVCFTDLSTSPSTFYDEGCLPPDMKILNPAKESREMDMTEVLKLFSHFVARFGMEGEVFTFHPLHQLSPNSSTRVAGGESEEEEEDGASGTGYKRANTDEEEWGGIREETFPDNKSSSDTDSDSDSEPGLAFHPFEEGQAQGYDQSLPSQDEGRSDVVMGANADDDTDSKSDTVSHDPASAVTNAGTNSSVNGDTNGSTGDTNSSISGTNGSTNKDTNGDAKAITAKANININAIQTDVEMIDNDAANPVDFANNNTASADDNAEDGVNKPYSDVNICGDNHGNGAASGLRYSREAPSTAKAGSTPQSPPITRRLVIRVPPPPQLSKDVPPSRPKRQSAAKSQSLTAMICAPRQTSSRLESTRQVAGKRKRAGEEGDKKNVSG